MVRRGGAATECTSALPWGWDLGRWDRRRAFRTKEDPEMAVKLSMFALRSQRACGKYRTEEAMRILATGRWARVLPHVKSGGGRRWIQLLQIRRLESVEDTVRAHVAMR